MIADPALRLVEHPWVVVDVETTGGRPDGEDRITEFAAVLVEGHRVVGEFSTLVHPGRPKGTSWECPRCRIFAERS
ncbi:MAG: hypothetical protein HY275_07470 [Gemmatimonadetes bacterium]|nr:hypothetical protein [Gemmatimonadota bacterium]